MSKTLVPNSYAASLETPRRLDGWANVMTGLGDSNRDKRLSTTFGSAFRMGVGELDELYHGDDVVARICDRPADEMTRQGIRLQHDDGPEIGKAVMQKVDDIEAMSKIAEAITWARLHGGSIILLGAEDGGTPDKPLREDAVRTFDWMTVMDRWDIQVDKYYSDPRAPKYGEPEFYRLQSSNIVGATGMPFGTRVHESRVLRFDGVRTGKRERHRNMGWARSVIERVYPVVRDFAASFGGMAHLLQDFAQAVFQIKGLANMLASDQDELVMRRLALLDMSRSVARAVPIDEDESLERKATPVAGLPELLDRMGERLSVATDMPVSILMGRSPAGLNATGKSDIRIWYDKLKAEQEAMLRRPLTKVLRLTMLAKRGPTNGREPANWSFVFNPLWQMDEAETVKVRRDMAETDRIYIAEQVLSPSEVRSSRFQGDVWSMETQLDPAFDDPDALRPEPVEPETDPKALGQGK
jgi:uncharacterized protein